MAVEAIPVEAAAPARAKPAEGRRRAIAAAIVGHAIEFYDFVIYGAFAPVLATAFFPESDRVAALLSTFLIYAVAYVVRPIGAVLFGHIGDRRGRKSALSAAILMMVGATVLIGVTPTFAEIGLWAAAMLFTARVLQGISVGGEFGGALSYMVELAPRGRRGFYGSAQMLAAGLGLFFGALVGAIITTSLPEQAVNEWGWRLAFLLAAPIGVVGFYIRLKLEDSPKFAALEQRHAVSSAPVLELVRNHGRNLVVAIGIVVVFTVSFSTWHIYMPAYLKEVVGMDFGTALVISCVSLGFLVLCTPVVGLLSDRFGRRPVAIAGTAALVVTTYPAFAILSTGDVALIVPTAMLEFALMAAVSVTVSVILTEYFPTRVRYSGAAVSYATGVALFGATAPLIQTWLVDRTGNDLAPAWYLVAGGLISLALLLFAVRETAGDELE